MVRTAKSGPRTRFFAAVALCALVLALAASAASAQELSLELRRRPHTIYGELLGKGGLWGVGYDYRFGGFAGGRFGLGGTLSAVVLEGQRVYTVSPYVAFALVERGRHGWFASAGPQLVRVVTPSPVPEWDGTSSTGVGAQLSSGWEYRGRRLVVRSYLMATLGKGGFAPWLGVDLGWRF
jgi:hypothetical protein